VAAGTRREFIGMGIGAVAVAGLGAAFWDDVFGAAGSAARSPRPGYGPRGPANEHGLRLPERFRSRLIARGREPVPGTRYLWHDASDGMACFPADGGGWVLVSNSETLRGGASAIRFDAGGRPEAAYRILDGTTQNCSGGGTPWGTWLSCEEVMSGLVWECDPAGRRRALGRPAMGVFKHEAAAVDPEGRRIYLTEDLMDGGVYRFTPTRWHDLSEGRLEIATVAGGGKVSWSEVPDPGARRVQTRDQVRGSTRFKRAEGIWHDDGVVYISTTGDHRVHAYDIARERIKVIYDGLGDGPTPLLRVDQLTANRAGEVFVCEDIATEEIDIGLIDRAGRVSKFLSATGPDHVGSELTGVTFDPSGSRMYFSSQRAFGKDGTPGPGAIYEVSGPFRGSRAFHATAPSA
jgi:secreted PhoX family phosphatase